jgi:acid stress chaperone HdeB
MKSSFIALGMLIAIVTVSPAKAQMTLDVSKITCRQFLLGKVGASTRSVANWLSGYYNGKRDNTVIEVGAMRKNERELERYCRKHSDLNIMDAAKQALGGEK